MARRANYFKTARESSDAVIISGGYEFAPFGTENDRHPAVIAPLRKAYDLLNYDLLLLSPSDATVLKSTKILAPSDWRGPLAKPELLSKDVQGGRLAFVLFPDSGQPDKAMEDDLVRFAESLRADGKYNLIIGVSTWGAARESEFIEKRKPVFDIILGSGEGPGYGGLYLKDNRVLWVRAFTKGKNVHTVTIPALPKPGTKVTWDPEVSIFTAAVALGGEIASAPEIEAIFNP